MDFLSEWIDGLLRGWLSEGIMGNLEGLFTDVNNRVGEVAMQVGQTPESFNAGVFNMIRTLSETVVLPIAGIVLTFVMCYELINIIVEKNNLHDVDTWIFFKWFFKTAIAVLILSNTWNIVMAVFDVSQSVINDAAGVIQGSTDVSASMLGELETALQEMSIGGLLGLWLQSIIIGFTMKAIGVVIFIIVFGRMIEIYMLTSLAPIPMATMVNREMGHMGQNYFRSLIAVGFQGLLIIVCVAIYAVLVQSVSTAGADGIIGALWSVMGYTVLLCFTLFKTGSLSKSIFGAH